jgi:hypothetical protein
MLAVIAVVLADPDIRAKLRSVTALGTNIINFSGY